MKTFDIFSMQKYPYVKIEVNLILLFSAMLLTIICPLSGFCVESSPLLPLDEAALKHSPGNLISEKLKTSDQFLLLNELLLIDELILKQTRIKDVSIDQKKDECATVPNPEELICAQVKVILQKKKEITSTLGKATLATDYGQFSDIDLLIELEIVDDLIIIQPQIKEALYELMRLCRLMGVKDVNSLINEQVETLVKKKKLILYGIEGGKKTLNK